LSGAGFGGLLEGQDNKDGMPKKFENDGIHGGVGRWDFLDKLKDAKKD